MGPEALERCHFVSSGFFGGLGVVHRVKKVRAIGD